MAETKKPAAKAEAKPAEKPAEKKKAAPASLRDRARALLPELDVSEDFGEAKLAVAVRQAFPDPPAAGPGSEEDKEG